MVRNFLPSLVLMAFLDHSFGLDNQNNDGIDIYPPGGYSGGFGGPGSNGGAGGHLGGTGGQESNGPHGPTSSLESAQNGDDNAGSDHPRFRRSNEKIKKQDGGPRNGNRGRGPPSNDHQPSGSMGPGGGSIGQEGRRKGDNGRQSGKPQGGSQGGSQGGRFGGIFGGGR
ncbi:hypothetical protein DdX_21882 [Ditylenchus destructor]|uniref:Uncharacterized protein n=1 Tax=Ditylenchus destructor TaxID=166010 RepID=A0AAD4QSU0_9BILA|nr:hypothetical protein DdX_21882 [Ditylenchus destructor]